MQEMLIGVSIAASALTSVIVTRVIAARYFKIVDGYVKDMCDLTDSANKRTLETIDKLKNIPALKIDDEALYRAVQRGHRKL
ncbi:MAG: hypothetical protein HFH59_09650 [Lachnospiraceae bacterium]|nr:hypothetical protein [Lachnospiraceae bacterium]